MRDSSTRVEPVLSIKGLDLWWVELEFLDGIYIMGKVPLHHNDLISLLEAHRDRAIFGIPFVMESDMPKTPW